MAADLHKQWGGEDSNLRPADYEFDPAHLRDQGESAWSTRHQQFQVPDSARRFATLCSPSRDTRGTHLSLVRQPVAVAPLLLILIMGWRSGTRTGLSMPRR